MRFVSGWLKSASAVCLGLCLVGSASAGVIINVVQSGSDVVLSMSGSLSNLGTPVATQTQNLPRYARIETQRWPLPVTEDSFFISNGGAINYSTYLKVSGPGPTWGSDYTMSSATSHASSLSFFSLTDSFMNLPSSYVFGTAITGSATFSNKTLAGIGLTNQGSYVYTFGSGANTDTVTFNIGGSGGGGGGGQVPEPSTMAIFGLGALGMAYRARRKAKA
jgi:hypothetical protein